MLADDVATAVPRMTGGVIGNEVVRVLSAARGDAQVHETGLADASAERYKTAEERNASAYLACLLDEADRGAFDALQFTSLDRDELDNVATLLYKVSKSADANVDDRELQKIAEAFSGFVRSAASATRTGGCDVTRDGGTTKNKFGELQKLTLRRWEKHASSAQIASEACTRRAIHESVGERLGGNLVGDVYGLKDKHAAVAQQRMKEHAFKSATGADSPGVKLCMIATALRQEDASPDLLRNVRWRNDADGAGVVVASPPADGTSPGTATPDRGMPDLANCQTVEADQNQDVKPIESGAALPVASEEFGRIADELEGPRRPDVPKVHRGVQRSYRARSVAGSSVAVDGSEARDSGLEAQPVDVPVAGSLAGNVMSGQTQQKPAIRRAPEDWQQGADGKWTGGGEILARIEAKKSAVRGAWS
ncbi:hypothetical protein [Pandoraea horticolens]|nr:hypothetical protein [Pandoraea horticolens]